MDRQTRKLDPDMLKKANLGEDYVEKCVIVSNIPPGTTEQPLQIHFMKSKNGGGDITKVQLLDKTTAVAVFEERETVDTVLLKEQKFGKNILKLQRYSELMVRKKTPKSQQLNKNSPVSNLLDKDQAVRSIVVRNLPPGISNDTVTIHFQKHKHGGGDIESVEMVGEDTAVITFDDRENVSTSLSKKQEMEGNVLKLTPYSSETADAQKVNKSSSGQDCLTEDQAERSLVVRNLPPGTDEQKVTIHFQKKRHGGGDVENVTMMEQDAAVVTFDECETVKTAIAKEQKLEGKVLTLTTYQSEFDATSANVEEDAPLIDFENENQAARSIFVSNLPDITIDDVTIHFQKTKNGGGDIENVRMVGKGTAVVTFDESETVMTALVAKHNLKGVILKVVPAQVRVASQPPTYEVFADVTASLNRSAFSSLNDNKFQQLMQRLQQESQVRVEQRATKYLLTGTFSQVKSSYSLLKKYFSDKDSFLKKNSNNSSHSKDLVPTKDTLKSVAKGGTVAKNELEGSFSENDERAWQQASRLNKNAQPTTRKDHSHGNFTLADTAEPENDTGKLEVQTYETSPIMIRFIKKVYKDRLNVISEEFSVNLSGSQGDTKLTIEPNVNCSDYKYNDACNEFIELYQGATQGVTKDFLTITPEKTAAKEEIKTAIRRTAETLPVLIERGHESNDWVIFGDRDSVEKAKENVQKQLGLSSATGKGRRKRAPATRVPMTDSVSETTNSENHASRPQGSHSGAGDLQNSVDHMSKGGRSGTGESETKNVRSSGSRSKSSRSGGDLLGSVEHVSKTGIKISVFQGDITEKPVDAIVNASNTALTMNDGLGRAILRAGGASIQEEADVFIRKHGSVKIGQAIWTKAGKLPCKALIHAVGPMDWPGQSERKSRQFLQSAYLNSLECARSLKLKSIAVPAIGTGIIGVPLEVCAAQLFNAIELFWGTKGELTDIRIVNLTEEANEVFKREFLKRFNSGQSSKNPSKSKSVKGDSEKVQAGKNTGNNVKHNISGTEQSLDNPRSGSASSNAEKPENNCVICMDLPKDPVSLDKCGHTFCKECIDQAFSHRKACPVCGKVYGVLTGNQPPGTMNWYYDKWQHLPGYERYGSIRINYFFPDGSQSPEHPNPGQRYYGTARTAFLPDCHEGREVLQLLKRAFDSRLTFTIGTSVTTGMRNVVTWNDIHHKTSIHGGSTGYGYPDPTYLARVKGELAAKGIV